MELFGVFEFSLEKVRLEHRRSSGIIRDFVTLLPNSSQIVLTPPLTFVINDPTEKMNLALVSGQRSVYWTRISFNPFSQVTDQSDADVIIEERRREKQMLEAIH